REPMHHSSLSAASPLLRAARGGRRSLASEVSLPSLCRRTLVPLSPNRRCDTRSTDSQGNERFRPTIYHLLVQVGISRSCLPRLLRVFSSGFKPEIDCVRGRVFRRAPPLARPFASTGCRA